MVAVSLMSERPGTVLRQSSGLAAKGPAGALTVFLLLTPNLLDMISTYALAFAVRKLSKLTPS